MMYGSSQQFLYDRPFSSDEEEDYDEEIVMAHENGAGKGHDYEEEEVPYDSGPYQGQERVSLAAFIHPKQQPTKNKASGNSTKKKSKKKQDPIIRRQREEANLRAKYDSLFTTETVRTAAAPAPVAGGQRARSRSVNKVANDTVEQWSFRFLSSHEVLQVIFRLPPNYPLAPPEVSASLSRKTESDEKEEKRRRKGKEKVTDVTGGDDGLPPPIEDDDVKDAQAFAEGEAKEYEDGPEEDNELNPVLYNQSIISLLEEKANQGETISVLAEMARQWMELFAERMQNLRKQKMLEARKKAEEEQRERERLANLREPVPAVSNFQAWLLRLGIKKPEKPKYAESVDNETIFEHKLALRKKKLVRRNVDKLWTLCIKAMGDSLMRYESLEGFPVQLRKEILDYLVSELRLLYPEHLDVLLDQDIDVLDFSGLATMEHRSKLKETHLKIVGAKCPRLKTIDVTGAVKLSSKGFAEGISKCHQLQRLIADDCTGLNDDAMSAIVEGCPLLVHFSARGCKAITSGSLYMLGRRCNDLSTVIVAGCEQIAIEGVLNLMRMAKRLQSVDATRVGNAVTVSDSYVVNPNRLCNQWLNSLILNGCKRVTNKILKELLGPLQGQVCPNLGLLDIRECGALANGVIEDIILPLCPNLRALHYSVPEKSFGISNINLNHISFLSGCTYAFPIRGTKLPPLLHMVRQELAHNASSTANQAPITQAEVRRLVPNPTSFLASVDYFERNLLARQAMRNITSLTLASCACTDNYGLLELAISLPALQYLDLSNSRADMRDLLLSCYYFLPRLETLIFKLEPKPVTPLPYSYAYSTPIGEIRRRERFPLRERQVKAKLLLDLEKESRMIEQLGDTPKTALAKRRQWVVRHIGNEDKRFSFSLRTLDLSGRRFADGAEFMDLIADRCPELRSLSVAGVSGIGERSLYNLLDKCVYLQHLDIRHISGVPWSALAGLRNKNQSLTILS